MPIFIDPGEVVVMIVWYWIYNYLCNQYLSPLKL